MKKVISIITVLVLLVTCFVSVPFANIISADTAANGSTGTVTEYVIDFEGAQGTAFYENNQNRTSGSVAVKATDDGNVMHFSELMVYRNDSYVNNFNSNAVKWNTIYYPTAFGLPNADGSGIIYLEKDAQYRVSFQMKKNAEVATTEFQSITAALVFADSYTYGDQNGNVRDWVNNGQTVTLAAIDLEADVEWITYTADITVPRSGYVAFMLYGETWKAKCDIDVDNIKIAPVTTVASDKIDFEGNQGTPFYGAANDNTNRITYADNVNIGTAENHGNVMHFNNLFVYRNDGSYNKWNTIYYPSAFRLPEADGSGTRYFEKDTQYAVTFQMKKNAAVSDTYFSQITAALVFADSYAFGNDATNIRDWVNNGQTATLAVIDLEADSDWVTYTANITVPVSGYGAFLLYGETWKTACNIDVDNIEIVPTATVSDKIDFEGNQGTPFYGAANDNTNRITYADNVDIGTAENHGNVMHFNNLFVYRNDGSYNKWNTIYYPSAFRLPKADGSGTLYFEKDEKYVVTFQMKKNAAVSDTYFSQMTAALVFADSYAFGNDATNIRDWVNNGQTATLAVIDLEADSDWVTYTANITVPRSGYVAFLLYGETWKTACNIDVDNIVISEPAEDNLTEIVLHNYDNKGNDTTITVDPATSYNDIERPFSDNAKFVSWYKDEALTIPAKGSVGDTAELWIKWRTELDQTIITFDEDNVVYETVIDEEENLTTAMVNRIVNGTDTQTNFAQYGTFITKRESVSETNLTNAVNFVSGRRLNWNWPALVKLYDSEDENSGLFIPEKNTAYKIRLKYRSNVQPRTGTPMIQLRALSTTGSASYNKDNVYVSNLATLTYATSGWLTAEATFTTGETVTPLFLTVIISGTSNVYTDVDLWIDDIEITEIYNTPAIYFDTMGGSVKNPQICIVGETIPETSVPTRNGYLFDGWFTDKDCTQPFTLNVMPAENIKLYAKWVETATEPYALKVDFESSDYTNDGTAPNIPDNINSEDLTWKNDSTAYEGNGFISVATSQNDNEHTQALPAVSFKDEKGESFQVVAGGRYRLTISARCNDISNNLFFVTTQQVPTFGVNVNNTVELTSIQTAADYTGFSQGQWGTYEVYFIAQQTGKVYLIFYNGKLGSMDIDSLAIEPVGQDVATVVEYYNEDGTLRETQFGKVGTLLRDASISNKEGYFFNGWRTADGTLHTTSFFPNKDTKLYASWREADDLTDAKSNITDKEYIIDFEDSEAAKIFYGTANNSAEPFTGVVYITGDKENARSGDSYLSLNRIGIWTETWFRRVKFFDPNSLGNQVYLDPLSVYRVSFWVNVETAGTSLIRVATFDSKNSVTTYKTHYQHMFQDAEIIEDLGKWVKYEADVVVGSEPESLGIVVSGGYFTANIDDITVQKLWDVTVSFDSNGGSEVEPIVALAYNCVVEPGYPIRDGYTFMGWYADKELTEPFKFVKTPITKDITLYAKWEKDFVPQVAYRDEVTYEDIETTVENIPEDAHLDENIVIVDNDEIKPISSSSDGEKREEEDDSFPWWIILIIVAAVLLLAVIVILIIILSKRRNKKD